ncbi:MAG TPA: quercetin 2,3-dioxygenase [Dehalococcoidia bacterium]|nr:quercetin 2,3-dioxygenase [Dehalococcoidia bacterium]
MSIDAVGRPYALEADGGDLYWFLDTLMEVKAGGRQTHGSFTVIEWLADVGFAPPPHVHKQEDEAFYVLEGKLSVRCGDDRLSAQPGAFVFLPRGIPHTFTVEEKVRALQITGPSRFEEFVAKIGAAAPNATLPPPSPPDVEKLLRVAREFDIEILPPT